MPDFIATLSRLISRIGLVLAGAGLVLMTLIISWQVFARYVLEASPAWSEQAALLSMTWFVLFAAAVGVREGFHIRITFATERLGPQARRIVRAAAHLAVGAFGLAMAVWGTCLILLTWDHVIPTLGLSRGVAYIPLPLSGVLIAFFAAEHIRAELIGTEVEPLWS